MISKKDFIEQIAATKTPHEFVDLIKNTYQTICKESLMTAVRLIELSTDIIELIEKVNQFNDSEVAYLFLEKIECFVEFTEDHQEILSLKKYLVDPETCPISLWRKERYSWLQIKITSQLIKTCNQISELDVLIHNCPQIAFEQLLSTYWERRQFLEKCDR